MGQIQKVNPKSTNKPARNPGQFSDMDLQHEADRRLEGSMALNTLISCRTGLVSYEKLLNVQGLENKWHPSTDNITHFIAYLSL
jgi:hypothetical protein